MPLKEYELTVKVHIVLNDDTADTWMADVVQIARYKLESGCSAGNMAYVIKCYDSIKQLGTVTLPSEMPEA